MKYENTWDLEAIFPGGTKSPELQQKLQSIKAEIREYESLINNWNFDQDKSAEPLKAILKKEESIDKGLGQAGTFVQMWHDAYMNDQHANVVMGQVMDLSSELENLITSFTKKLVAITDEDWQVLLQDDVLQEVAFALNEIRAKGKIGRAHV